MGVRCRKEKEPGVIKQGIKEPGRACVAAAAAAEGEEEASAVIIGSCLYSKRNPCSGTLNPRVNRPLFYILRTDFVFHVVDVHHHT